MFPTSNSFEHLHMSVSINDNDRNNALNVEDHNQNNPTDNPSILSIDHRSVAQASDSTSTNMHNSTTTEIDLIFPTKDLNIAKLEYQTYFGKN